MALQNFGLVMHEHMPAKAISQHDKWQSDVLFGVHLPSHTRKAVKKTMFWGRVFGTNWSACKHLKNKKKGTILGKRPSCRAKSLIFLISNSKISSWSSKGPTQRNLKASSFLFPKRSHPACACVKTKKGGRMRRLTLRHKCRQHLLVH